MLILTPVTAAAAPYYFNGQGPGRWVGAGSVALGLTGDVGRRELVSVLRGCHPGDGRFLPVRKPARRRAGWDLTLAAPKSVSLLAAMAKAGGDVIAAAHRAAIIEVLGHLERRLLRVRRAAAPGGQAPSVGAVAAAFDHESNRSAEPHLHTHLLLCNLGRDDQLIWSSLSNVWWTEQHSLSAIYQLGLHYQLHVQGLDLAWRVRPDGLADLADVPRATVRAVSGRSRAAAADRAEFEDRQGGRRLGVRTNATVQTRPLAGLLPWQQRVAPTGFTPDDANAIVGAARAGSPIGPETSRLESAVTSWLASRRSSFRYGDVLVALAACMPEGLAAERAEGWASRFCDGAIPVAAKPTASPRWTTGVARLADQRLAQFAGRIPRSTASSVPANVLAAAGEFRHPLAPEANAAARALVSSGRPVHILTADPGRTNLLAQAAVLEAAGQAWRAAGLTVAIASSDQAALRWRTLTGMAQHSAGMHPDVLVVDHADRRPTPELMAVLADMGPGQAVVFLEGGTMPRLSWGHSDGLALLGTRLGRLYPGPTPNWTRLPGHPAGNQLAACSEGAAAAAVLLARWEDARAGRAGQQPALLVGLGYAEVDGLNLAARRLLAEAGQLTGPTLYSKSRAFQVGDDVIALRRLSASVQGGTRLQVADIDRRGSTMTLQGEKEVVSVDRAAATHVGYGYAMTPGLAARTRDPLLVLGPPSVLGKGRERVIGAAVVVPELAPIRTRTFGRDGASLDVPQTPTLGAPELTSGPVRGRLAERDLGMGLV